MNPQEILFRCSSLGKIISKSGKLTDGVKTYLKEVFIKEKFGIQKDIASKYFDKGIACEQDGIKMLNQVFAPDKFVAKNKIEFANAFIKGSHDVVIYDTVFDVKNAYDIFTFQNASLTHDYEWQLKGYSYLLGLKKAKLFYCLSNMPDFMLANEEKKLFYSGGLITTESPEYAEACIELRKKYIYDYLNLEERFKVFSVEFTETDKEIIDNAVEVARNYIGELNEEYTQNAFANRQLIEENSPCLVTA